MTTPAEARILIANRLRTIPALVTVWTYEPENLGALPASTLLLQAIDPQEVSTGPRLDVTWTMQLRLYVNLSDWHAAQDQLEELAWATLSLWRDDPTLGGAVEWWRIGDGGQPPEFSPEQRWLRKTLLASVVIEHVGK